MKDNMRMYDWLNFAVQQKFSQHCKSTQREKEIKIEKNE